MIMLCAWLNSWTKKRVASGGKAAARKLEVEALENRVVMDAAFVNALFQQYLGRDPGDAGRAYWVGVQEQTGSPAAVASGIIHSAEAQDVELRQVYARLLGR